MALDFPATAQVLWSLWDAGGPRPEYVLPVLYSESGFDPSTPNRAGAPYYGIGQTAGTTLSDAGVSVSDFLTWPASEQISHFVGPYFLSASRSYGPIRSGARAFQANFLPATLASARALDSVVSQSGDPYYASNQGLDWQHKGAITVRDLAHFIEHAARSPSVQAAIAQTYELRPQDKPHEPVLGEDFSGGGLGMFAAAASFAAFLYALVRG